MGDILAQIDSFYTQYLGDVLSETKQKQKDFEKKMIHHLMQLSNMYNGNIDYSIPGVVFITYHANGIKPLNKYNFYFESGIFRCNNQINFHQKYSHIEINESNIDNNTFCDIIHEFIMNIPLELIPSKYSPEELTEFSNPF